MGAYVFLCFLGVCNAHCAWLCSCAYYWLVWLDGFWGRAGSQAVCTLLVDGGGALCWRHADVTRQLGAEFYEGGTFRKSRFCSMAGVSCLIDPFMFECQIKQHCFTMCRVWGELYVISNESLVSSFLQVDELDEKCHLLSSYANTKWRTQEGIL